MSVPQLVLRRTVFLFIFFAIALMEFEHDVVVPEYTLYVLSEVVELVAYTGIGDGAVGSEGLEGAGADVESLHDFLAVNPVFE